MAKPKYERKPDGTRYNPAYGRIMTHEGYANRIFWSREMIDYLQRHYPTTLNEELAGCLGVSKTTLARKARELKLEKDPAWLAAVYDERRRMAHAANRMNGNSGQFRKGRRSNPAGEFGSRAPLTDEQVRKRAEGMRRWYRLHPEEARAKARKAWETRLARRATSSGDGGDNHTDLPPNRP